MSYVSLYEHIRNFNILINWITLDRKASLATNSPLIKAAKNTAARFHQSIYLVGMHNSFRLSAHNGTLFKEKYSKLIEFFT